MCRNEKEIEDRKERFGIRDSQDGLDSIRKDNRRITHKFNFGYWKKLKRLS